MTSKLLTGIIALALPVYVAAQFRTTPKETALLDEAALRVMIGGKTTTPTGAYDWRFNVPFRMEKNFYDGKDSLRVTIFNINGNLTFDEGDKIIIDDPLHNPISGTFYESPIYVKTHRGYVVEPPLDYRLDLAQAHAFQKYPTDPSSIREGKKIEKNISEKTEKLYKEKLRMLEQAYSRR